MSEDFGKQFQQELLKPDRKYTLAEIVWARYYVKTELFDRALPGGWSPHDPECWIPFQKTISMEFAHNNYKLAEQMLDALEIDSAIGRETRRTVSGMPFARQIELSNKELP